ncbi:hypothetical protein BDV11DRAFT_189240 [Aspergillus similis]
MISLCSQDNVDLAFKSFALEVLIANILVPCAIIVTSIPIGSAVDSRGVFLDLAYLLFFKAISRCP